MSMPLVLYPAQQTVVHAWHFLRGDRRLAYAPYTAVKIGVPVYVTGDLALCSRGLHAAPALWDALRYAPGPVACRVALADRVIVGEDKMCASRRVVLGWAGPDETAPLIRAFMLDVFEYYLDWWEADRLIAPALIATLRALLAVLRKPMPESGSPAARDLAETLRHEYDVRSCTTWGNHIGERAIGAARAALNLARDVQSDACRPIQTLLGISSDLCWQHDCFESRENVVMPRVRPRVAALEAELDDLIGPVLDVPEGFCVPHEDGP